MMPIGTPYNRENYNCAHYVCEYFGIPHEKGERELLWALRHHFKRIDKPEDGCLVVCNPPLHVGFYSDFMVQHNCGTPGSGGGQVIRTPICMFKTMFKNVRYFKYHGKDKLPA